MVVPASIAKDFALGTQRKFSVPGKQLGGVET